MAEGAPLRVVVWSTGGIGSIAVRAVAENPSTDLVGVWVHSADKAGRDAGEIVGIGPIGVTATTDVDELIALHPDCVVYAASGPERDAAAVPDYVRLLEAGINVVTTTVNRLIYPPGFEPDIWRNQLAEAAQVGGVSLYASGIEPGFAADHLVLMLATQSKSIRTISASEIALYDDYPVAETMMDAMGFGRPLDYMPALAYPGTIAFQWGPGLRLIAHGLGLQIDEIRETFDRVPTDRDLHVAFGTAEAGTCGALRTRATAVIDGREAITIEHVNRLAPDLGVEWAEPLDNPVYRIRIEGEPDIACDMTASLRDPKASGSVMDGGAGAMVSTAMRVVNAIPYVVEAKPGLVSALDLPLTLPRNVLR
ncbi:dihydrodipicolinate reductase [Aldersonia kunmingensis]|uniref:NAD(P)H-dependent amine dehydrogenase family protein n=1 Tax=Aldersonia kunmingensis TaxID=408066 RepID=UPI0008370389|nr:dihydrodipicolinate reductase [Aldersonia kunmingensis]